MKDIFRLRDYVWKKVTISYFLKVLLKSQQKCYRNFTDKVEDKQLLFLTCKIDIWNFWGKKKERERDGKLRGDKSIKSKKYNIPIIEVLERKIEDWREKTTNSIIDVYFSRLKTCETVVLTWVISRKGPPYAQQNSAQETDSNQGTSTWNFRTLGSKDKDSTSFPREGTIYGVTRRGEGIRKASGCWREQILEMGDNGSDSYKLLRGN